MLNLKGYNITKTIRKNVNSTIYCGIRTTDQQPVIIKWHNSAEKNFVRKQKNLEKELEITALFPSEKIIKAYEIINNSEGCGLVLEDFGGRSLKDVMAEQKLDIDTFLKIASSMADTLGRVHQKNIIHKDINPGNIIVNPDDWLVKITDFGIASRLSREEQAVVSAERLEGTMAYISPEQTGRMNRSIDYRTDIYSLGMTFYEILTGVPAFQAEDAIGWVHNHIAVRPIAPHDEHPEVPEALSHIVMKMLEKNAEDRYQSAFGIMSDLVECRTQLQNHKNIESFELGRKDKSGVFQIPQKLYGREKEIKTLLGTFDGAMELGKSEMLTVAGYSGIGKSVLIKEIHRPIVKRRGYFISGKFDQLERNIPYSAIIQAFQDLLYQLVSESESQLGLWKKKLLDALGPNGQVIIDMIPQVELIIGKQPPVTDLSATEARARFNITFQKFIEVFTAREHPLVLFLDDLQWADSATLNLLSVLMTAPNSSYLFLIGAYRDNEVHAAHPFMVMMDGLRKEKIKIHTLVLHPLKSDDVNSLVQDSLSINETQAAPLAKLLMDKTEGNPFFVNEFLKSLVHDELLRYDIESDRWLYSAAKIDAQKITNNVVELMIGRMKKLPANTQTALQLASCIGNKFDLRTLAVVSEEEIEDTAGALWPAIQEGMLMPVGDSQDLEGAEADRFIHDRVQQAAYATIAQDQKQKIHLKIGRLLLTDLNEGELEERLFEVIGHLNQGRELIQEQSEKIKTAELNLQAGIKAKASAAFQPALNFLNIARELLPDNAWESRAELTGSVYLQLAEAAYSTADYELLDQVGDILIQKSEQTIDKLKVYEMKANGLFGRSKMREGFDAGLEGLRLVGIKFPAKTKVHNILGSVLFTKIKLLGKPPEYLEKMPVMENSEIALAMHIMVAIVPIAYFTKDPVLPLLTLRMVQLSIKYGNAPASILAYGLYGLILCGIFMDFKQGYEFGELCYRLSKQPFARYFQGSAITTRNFSTRHWRAPMRNSLRGEGSQMEALEKALEMGKVHDAALGLQQYSYLVFYSGVELTQIAEEFPSHVELCIKYRQKSCQNSIEAAMQMVLNFMGRNENPVDLSGEFFQEERFPDIIEAGDETTLGFAYIYKTLLAYIFKDYEKALLCADIAQNYMDAVVGMPHAPVFWTFSCLVYLARARELPKAERKALLKKVKVNRKRMKKLAQDGPANYKHKYQLIEAELSRLQGRQHQAIDFYENAILGARDNSFIHEEALANERFADFWQEQNKPIYYKLYMTEARRLYQRWGAKAKVKQIQDMQVLDEKTESRRSHAATGQITSRFETTTTGIAGTSIDLGSMLKATRNIAGEIKLNRLLGTLMEIVLENAGARRGFLLLENEGEMELSAFNDMDRGESKTNLHISLSELEEQGTELAASVVRYSARTQDSVVLNDASNDETFSRDLYIKKNNPRSILCSPIINQGRLMGLLYMENNLTTGAFTPERLEILNMLSSQAAISLENAVLYDNMENKVEERTKEVKDILSNVEQGIFTINQDYFLTGGHSGLVPRIFESIEFDRHRQIHINELAQEPKLEEYLELLFTSPFINQKLIRNANPIKVYDHHFKNQGGKDALKKLTFSFSRIFETDENGLDTKKVQKLMVVVNDKTDEFEREKELEEKAQEQAGKVEKLYQILQLEPSIFSNFISESTDTLNQVESDLNDLGEQPDKNKKILRSIFREVHTLKGNARALSLDSIGKTAHELEDVFDELQKTPEKITKELKEKTRDAVADLRTEIQDGDSLFKKILNMQNSLQSEPKDPMSEFADRFRGIIQKESELTGKQIEFQFRNNLKKSLNNDVLKKLRDPLSHILRNSVSHGIEDASIRTQLSKSKSGHISLQLGRNKDGELLVLCEDDGGGLDTNKIKEKAERPGLFTKDELNNMSVNQINKLIFSSGLSTKNKVTDDAGRGVGMDAVREDLKALNAVIGIRTRPDQFTKFWIKIPGY